MFPFTSEASFPPCSHWCVHSLYPKIFLRAYRDSLSLPCLVFVDPRSGQPSVSDPGNGSVTSFWTRGGSLSEVAGIAGPALSAAGATPGTLTGLRTRARGAGQGRGPDSHSRRTPLRAWRVETRRSHPCDGIAIRGAETREAR